MKNNLTKEVESCRITKGRLRTDATAGVNGAFKIAVNHIGLGVIVSDGSAWAECGLAGTPWEHVSVSLRFRCPTWEEMDHIKRMFWRDDETVMQLHVPRSKHVNKHNHCLHLWRPVGVEIPFPPLETV